MKIHLGCWKRNLPGWTNVDLCDLPHIHFKRSIDDLSCFDDNSADIIYSSHSLEYFDRDQTETVLKEWRRVLKTGGILRVAVPDFEALIQLYMAEKDINLVLGPLYGRMAVATESGYTTLYHKTTFDEASLRKILELVGFKNIKRYDWRETEHLYHDDHSQAYFPHMDKENGLLLSLNLEAEKC